LWALLLSFMNEILNALLFFWTRAKSWDFQFYNK
jgi:hypothetical protein